MHHTTDHPAPFAVLQPVTVRAVHTGPFVETKPTEIDSPETLYAWAEAVRIDLAAHRVDAKHAYIEVRGPLSGTWLHPVRNARPVLIKPPSTTHAFAHAERQCIELLAWCRAAVVHEARRAAVRAAGMTPR